MHDTPDLSVIASLLGEASRGAMLTALMDGRSLTATELALEAGVTPSTASSHLARLIDARLLAIEKQGRHRYYRIATAEVARVMETLMAFAPERKHAKVRVGPRDESLRRARVCYDHLAGEAGVRLLNRMRERKLLDGTDDELSLTTRGETWAKTFGIDLAALHERRRPLCRPCLDWSERRAHLAGALGAAILERLFRLRYARREPGSRAIALSARGEQFLDNLTTP
jgi:DNA-binding transcriptional ArsR family regulator